MTMGAGAQPTSEIQAILAYANDPGKLENLKAEVAGYKDELAKAISGIDAAKAKAKSEAQIVLDSAKENADAILSDAGDELDRRLKAADMREEGVKKMAETAMKREAEILRGQAEIDTEQKRLHGLAGSMEDRERKAEHLANNARETINGLKDYLSKLDL